MSASAQASPAGISPPAEDASAVDFGKCIAHFNETCGCGICVAVCPWSTPGRAPTLAQKWQHERSAL